MPIFFQISGFVNEDEPLVAGDPFALIEEANRLLRDSLHLMCFTADLPDDSSLGRYGSESSLGRYGDGARRSRMWAQYAGNHTGVCLCFDAARLIEAAQEQLVKPGRTVIHRRVDYASEGDFPYRPSLHQPQAEQDLPKFIEEMVERHGEDLFFTKDWDWSSETEYRLLLRGDTGQTESIDIRGALEAVIAGQTCHPVYRPALFMLCQELDVAPYVIQWESGQPRIHPMPDPQRRRNR
jgi:hypothetical protein